MRVDCSLFPVRRVVVAGLLVSLLAAGGAQKAVAEGSEGPLITDRPDITESAAVVGHGRFQVETSVLYQVTRLNANEEDVFSTPTLLRVGVGERFELRLGSNLYTRQDITLGGQNTTDSGLSPLSLGAKVRIADGDETLLRPGVAILVQAELPSGASVFKVRRATGQLLLAADSDITDALGLGVNIGVVVFETNAEEVRTGGLISAALGYGFTDVIGAFLEFAGSGVGLAADDQLFVLDAGLVYLFGLNMQVDLAGGVGLNEKSVPDVFVTVGFSFRSYYWQQGN